MTFQIVSTQQASSLHGIKFCIYGRSSAGKTRLCATAPTPIIISAEHGMLSLRQLNLPCIVIDNLATFEDVGKWLWSSAEARQFHTVCVDSATEIAQQVLTNELANNKDGRKAYGAMNNEIMRVLRNYRNLPNHHVYFSAHQDWDTDGTTGRTSFRPGMPGKTLTQELPYLFDEIFQLHVYEDQNKNQLRALRTAMDMQYDAKDRSGMLAPWEPADLTHIITKILRTT